MYIDMIDNLVLSTEIIESEDPALSAAGIAGCVSTVYLSMCAATECPRFLSQKKGVKPGGVKPGKVSLLKKKTWKNKKNKAKQGKKEKQ